MKLRVERISCGLKCTLGKLYVDEQLECFTLEDRVREDGRPVNAWKVPRVTAIPTGTYDVVITPSKRFGRDLPLLQNVPGFSGVRIHPGNTAEDTEGCILVGKYKAGDSVAESRAAFSALFGKILGAMDRGEAVTLEVK